MSVCLEKTTLTMAKTNDKKGVEMKLRILVTVLGVVLLESQIGAQELKSQKEKLSYIVGMDIGKNLRTQLIDVDPAILTRGIKDGLSGNKSVLTDQEVRDTLTAFQKDMIAKRQVLAEKNRKEGEAFLVENKKKKNVTTLPSGLQYKVIKAGTGKKPKPTDTVTVNYRGTLIDGTEFDSSYRRGQPITFPLNGVIPGWTEALGLMQEGAKWQIFVPSNLAYGEKGSDQIGPNATLIFEVELISVQEKK
jgi:FKBP-type peptidyl-prolyl cis-trans isomerase FklB